MRNNKWKLTVEIYFLYNYKILDEDENNEDDGDSEDESYSDDEDLSWKVRRSSAKCIEALVNNFFVLFEKNFFLDFIPS